MGIFDFFSPKLPGKPEPKPKDKKLASLMKTATDKRSQGYDRDEALRGLIKVGTPAAAVGLLKRMTFMVDPSITDQEEKQLAFEGLLAIGQGQRLLMKRRDKDPTAEVTDDERKHCKDSVVKLVCDGCKRATNLTWHLKVLRGILEPSEYEANLLSLLSDHDTEYTRNVEPKVNIIGALEELKSDAIRVAVEEYLDDVNETVRYHAVHTLFEQGDDRSLAPMVRMAEDEESVRIKNKVAAGLLEHKWVVTEDLRDTFRSALSDSADYRLDDDGNVLAY